MRGSLLPDLRFAIRMLAKNPGFTAVIVVMLALGIAANTTIFSVANALLLRPLPYQDPGRLVIVTEARGPNRRPFSYVRAKFLEQRSRSLDAFAPFVTENFSLTGRGEPELLPSARVAWSFFHVLGVRPAIGRTFQPEEDRPGGPPVALISDSLWKRRFGADPHAIGQSIILDSVATTVIGVMPPNFEFAPLGRSIDLWSTRTYETNGITAEQARLGAAYLIAVAKIRPGLPLEQAQAEMGLLDAQYRSEYSTLADADPRQKLALNPFQALMVANVRTAVLVLLGAVACLLFITCANVAGLLLSRALARRKEIAIRTALGASRGSIVIHLLIESVLLSLLGGGLGVALSAWSLPLVSKLPPNALPRINTLTIDGRVLAFAISLSVITGILFGLVPALQLSKTDLQGALRDEGRGIAGGRRRNWTRRLLVVSEVALSTILLIGAGLLMRSYLSLRQVTLGFDPDRVLLMTVSLPPSRYPTSEQIGRFCDRVVARVSTLPGVVSAGMSSTVPLHPSRYAALLPEGQNSIPVAQWPALSIQAVTPGYFETMRIPILSGRTFDQRDNAGAPPVVMVNRLFARRFWTDGTAVGKHILPGPGREPAQVVGVAGDVKNIRLAVEMTPEVYYPLAQYAPQSMNLVVRCAFDPKRLIAPIRTQILSLDKDQPVTNVRTMEENLSESIAQDRLTAILISVFSIVALLVATVGLYALISYSVAQRTQELGIRLALGAAPSRLLRYVILQGVLLAVAGVLVGVAGSYGLTRVLKTLLFQVSATDTSTFVVCGMLFIAIAFIASLVPARRAARLDPADALRHE